jgi:hypothetical protein
MMSKNVLCRKKFLDLSPELLALKFSDDWSVFKSWKILFLFLLFSKVAPTPDLVKLFFWKSVAP